jgi:hypothetical protein
MYQNTGIYVLTKIVPDEVKVDSYLDIGFTESQIEIIKEIVIPKLFIKCCFYNACVIAETLPDVEYVTGEYMTKELPLGFPHAWNKYQGKYFDMSVFINNNLRKKKFIYYKLIEGNLPELIKKGYDFSKDSVTDLYTQALNKSNVK